MPPLYKRTGKYRPFRYNKGIFLLPGSNYIGPGNTLDGAPPLNAVDDAAFRHDTATDFEYFRHNPADDRFISEVEAVKPRDWTERFHKTAALGWHYTKRALFPHAGTPITPPRTPKRRRANRAAIRQGVRRQLFQEGQQELPPVVLAGAPQQAQNMAIRRPYRRAYRRRRPARRVVRRRLVRRPGVRRSRIRRSVTKRRSMRRVVRRKKKMPVIMNQEVGLRFKKMRPFIPKVAGTVVSNFWSKMVSLTIQRAGRVYVNSTNQIPTEVDSFFDTRLHNIRDYQDNIIYNEDIFPQPAEAYLDHAQSRRKYLQVFKTGQLNSVASQPIIRTRQALNGLQEATVINAINPFVNFLALRQKPGYPHELMARLYRQVRVTASKYTIRMSIKSENSQMDRDFFGRFYVQYGIFWPKPQSQDPETRSAEAQLGQEVMNKSMEQLKIQPGVVTRRLGRKTTTLKIFIPAEKLANKRLNEAWKWVDNPLPNAVGATTNFTVDTTPLYTDPLAQDANVRVPYYPWNDRDSRIYPMFWFMIHDMNPFSLHSENDGQTVNRKPTHVLRCTVKEKKYHIYSAPLFNRRSQQWTQGPNDNGVLVDLPEHARVTPYDSLIARPTNVSIGMADETSREIAKFRDQDIQNIVQNNNTSVATLNFNTIPSYPADV